MAQRSSTHSVESNELPGLAGALHDSLGAGVLVVGAEDLVLCHNAEAGRQLGWPPGKTTRRSLADLPPPIEKLIREVLASGKPVAHRTVVLATDREAPAYRLAAMPFQTGDGKTQVVVTLNDIAIVRRIERNLNRLDRLASLGTLSAGMGHEIRNAFVAIRTFVDLLLEKNRDAELAEVVGREMLRIDSILSQMLKFAAPARSAFASVRVHEVLEHALRMLQHQFDGKLIALNRHFATVHDTINGDDYQLEQAFVNLFFNALEAMGPHGTLSVGTELFKPDHATKPFIRVTVADNGIGIAPENMCRLFEPFFTTKRQGTGLGLAIARRIVREHHGEISATSELNKGTTFQILLPVQPAAT